MAQGQTSLHTLLAGVAFTSREEALARARGTTVANLKNVAMHKVLDAQVAVREMLAVCEEGEARDMLQPVSDALV